MHKEYSLLSNYNILWMSSALLCYSFCLAFDHFLAAGLHYFTLLYVFSEALSSFPHPSVFTAPVSAPFLLSSLGLSPSFPYSVSLYLPPPPPSVSLMQASRQSFLRRQKIALRNEWLAVWKYKCALVTEAENKTIAHRRRRISYE